MVRALASHARGQGFKSLCLHQKREHPIEGALFFAIKRITKGLEGRSRFAGAKRFALRGIENGMLVGKGRR